MGLLSRVASHSTRLSRRRALVIGGSGGIGRAVTYALASVGATVVCHGGTDEERLERVVQYIQANGGRARGLFVPLRQGDELLPYLPEIGTVDILVVSMGPVVYRSLAETDADDWRRMINLNLLVPGLLVSHYLPRMVERGWGRVVLFAGPSADSIRGYKDIAAYGAAKSGVVTLGKSAARQTHGTNISVNCISPGYVNTEYLSVEERERTQRKAPTGVLTAPERIARLVNHLILAEEPDVNGAVITVDQGL